MINQQINIDALKKEVEKLYKRRRIIHAIKVYKSGETLLDITFNNYNKEELHGVFSCTKSILSILIGIAIDNAFIKSVEDKVIDLLPNYRMFFDEEKSKMTLKDLLSMRTAIEWDEFSAFGKNEGIWTYFLDSDDAGEYVLTRPLEENVGEIFNYNSGVSHLLSIIIEENTNFTTYDFANKFLFELLDISKENIKWETDKKGIVYGGHGLSMKLDDLEKIGIMCLDKGLYKGKRVLSSSWIEEATQFHSKNTRGYAGYGYQFWKGSVSDNDFYAAFGHGGQRLYVFEEKDMLITFLGNVKPEFGIQEKIIREYILNR